ncbi:lymphocyte antigen 86 [Clupea harengus]|uniref:Lymphocyte antigen 86 n=1 Tax=Clupea harengus TaxID=7950 RepID=A0A6P8GWX5_CLUHA|nr:lymphocyte antigen 86 [Clupea harengus]
MALLFMSQAVLLFKATAEQVRWPEHVLCNSPNFQLSYVSCDPFQDVGLTLNPCPDLHSVQVNSSLSLVLNHSIEELYLSLDLIHGDQKPIHYDDSLCLSHLPRFTFCGRRKGELVNHDWPLKIKAIRYIKGQFNAEIRLVNQDGHQIACANVSLNKG